MSFLRELFAHCLAGPNAICSRVPSPLLGQMLHSKPSGAFTLLAKYHRLTHGSQTTAAVVHCVNMWM